MLKLAARLTLLTLTAWSLASRPIQTQAGSLQVYGAWHCGNDACTWSAPRTPTEFDAKNRWLIDRGDGRPSVNVVVLSFVHPLRLLQKTTDAQTLNGIPRGMNSQVVSYFTSRGVRVMLSIGGITYVTAWNQALAADPVQLGLNAAEAAAQLGVGIEIDYEENRSPNLAGLEAFINAYRSQHPYDATGANPAARLTIDLAAGDRWLIGITAKATRDWLDPRIPVLDYANAMVTARQPRSASDAQANWKEHVDGKPQYSPPILPLAPAKFTGSLWLVGSKPIAECTNFASRCRNRPGPSCRPWRPIRKVRARRAACWATCSGPRSARARASVCTTPPNTCQGGVGAGATAYAVPIPMPALRQQ